MQVIGREGASEYERENEEQSVEGGRRRQRTGEQANEKETKKDKDRKRQ